MAATMCLACLERPSQPGRCVCGTCGSKVVRINLAEGEGFAVPTSGEASRRDAWAAFWQAGSAYGPTPADALTKARRKAR